MNVNITEIKTACRNAANEYLLEAEAQQKRYDENKNWMIYQSARKRKKEALQVAHQLTEWADGRRGLISKAIHAHAKAFSGKRKTEFRIAMGGYGAKVSGFIHRKGTQPQVVLAIDRDRNARIFCDAINTADWWYGD